MKLDQAKIILASPANQKFITDFLKADIQALLLKHHGDDEKRFLIEQIGARQKIRKKIPEWYSNPRLYLPPTLNLEQSSSSETAQLKASHFQGQSFTDLTGGMGIDFYNLGRKFKKRTYVEPDTELFQIAVYNFGILNFSGEFLNLSAEEALPHLEAQNLIYLDPSRRSEEKGRIINLEDYAPNVFDLQELLLEKSQETLIKTSPMYSLEQGVNQFKNLSEIWTISLRNDCKELLFKITEKETKPVMKAWNILPETTQYFEAPYSSRGCETAYAEPKQFLYEPNASVLKASLAEVVAKEYALFKLHPNSHIYTSENLVKNYPGKTFTLIGVEKPFTKSLKKKRYNVIARNFPDKAPIIEKKLQLKPAKTAYLIATTTLTRKAFLIADLLE